MNNSASVSFDETSNQLLSDPETAALYLQECLEEGDMELFKLALKHVADARTQATNLTREPFYLSFSKQENPSLNAITKVLDMLGLRMGVSVKT